MDAAAGRVAVRYATTVTAALVVALAVAGCVEDPAPGDEAWGPIVAFDSGAVRIETGDTVLRLGVELAETEDQWRTGLMERPSLAGDRGMLFVYPAVRDTTYGFYMFRTRIPLDIAFIDGDGRIVDIVEMAPCASPNPRTCRIYRSAEPYRWALEVNRGWFAERGIGMGDRVVPIEDAASGARE